MDYNESQHNHAPIAHLLHDFVQVQVVEEPVSGQHYDVPGHHGDGGRVRICWRLEVACDVNINTQS